MLERNESKANLNKTIYSRYQQKVNCSYRRMENQDITFNTICRVCLNHEKLDKMVSLIDTSQKTGLSPYGSNLEEITKKPVKKNKYMPTNLCQKCKECLEGVSRLMTTCKVSERKLKKLIKFSLKQDLEEAMVKEVVRQYTLFSQNLSEGVIYSNQLSTSEYDLQIRKQTTETENYYPKIKVKVEVQEVNSSSDLDSDDKNDNTSQIKTDVDIFIDSIKKLLTTNTEAVMMTEINSLENNDSKSESQEPIQDKKKKPKVEDNLKCKICQKVLATPKTYKNHIQRHGVCRFVCDQCGKSFPINAELIQHQIHSHGANSQYECDTCSYHAVKKIQLIEHIRLHTGERPFTCEKCGLTFRRKTLYNKHAKFHGERTIQCDYCPRKFFVRSAMLAHRNNKHNREFFYSCRICNITYAMARTVKKHMLDKHGIPKHLQGKVQKRYKSATDDTLLKSVVAEEYMYL